jgi:hypothetical protein
MWKYYTYSLTMLRLLNLFGPDGIPSFLTEILYQFSSLFVVLAYFGILLLGCGSKQLLFLFRKKGESSSLVIISP